MAASRSPSSVGPTALGVLAGAGALWWIVDRLGIGGLIAILILGALNALPGPSLEVSLRNSITAQDVVVAALSMVLLYQNSQTGFRHLRSTRTGRLLVAWSGAFLLWYAWTLVHTWTTTPVPLIHAMTFSRGFAYFAVTLPLLFGALRTEAVRSNALRVLAVGATVSCVAQILAVAGHASLPFLLHVNYAATTAGLTRVRGVASDIPFAGLPLGYGLVLYGRSPRQRAFGALLASSALLAIILSLTRAMYVGQAVGLTLATAIALHRFDARAQTGRRRLARISVVMLVVILSAYAFVPSSLTRTALAGIGTRANSLVAFLSRGTQDSALRVRASDIQSIEYAMRGHVWTGVGELDPTYVYVVGLPQGDIANGDVSLLGNVAMIGIIGMAIYSLPIFATLGGLIRERWRRRSPGESDWIMFGGVAWCVAVIVVSPTLGLTVSAAEDVGSATFVALLLGFLSDPDGPRRRHRVDVGAPASNDRGGSPPLAA